MKIQFTTCTALAALMFGMPGAVLAADQAPDTPAGSTAVIPQPSLAEEVVYLRDRMAVQTLRLDEAEQLLQRQQKFIELQEQKINDLAKRLDDTYRMAAAAQRGETYAASQGGVYTVKRGDTLTEIAGRENTTVAAMMRANNLRSANRLRVGQKLTIPGAPAPQIVATAPQAEPSVSTQQSGQQSGSQAKTPPQKVNQNQKSTQNAPQPQRVAQNNNNQPSQPSNNNLPKEVGVRPDENDKKPYLSIFSDVGGILTPRGTLFVEPEIGFTTSTDNRFFFRGVEIVDAVLIGLIEATDTDRRAASGRLGLRYGVTSRLEVDSNVSYVYRDDRIVGVEINGTNEQVRSLNGDGIGDINFGVHYQVNQGKNWPYVIANLRAKAPTGKGPFEVQRDESGIETELPTGSGFWSIEPSMTIIIPSDPAILFANIGYQYNMPTSPNATVGSNVFREFNPGDAIKMSLGVGLSINERMSINFGYDQSYFTKTKSLVDVIDTNTNTVTEVRELTQPSTVVGSFLFGSSYTVNNRLRLNLNTAFGATASAPDMRVTLKAQIKLFQPKKK